MLKRPHHVALLLVVLLVLVLLNVPDRAVSRLKLALSSLFLPLFGLAGSVEGLAERAGDVATPRWVLLQELEQLRRETNQVRLQLAQAEAALRENARLRQLLGWKQQSPWRLKPARVIARDTANWWRACWIDVGKRDGVGVGAPVLSAEGLLGKVIQAGQTSSQVVLVGDPKCRVAVVVRESGDQGVISAASAGVLDHRVMDLTHLPRNTNLKPGQTVCTSGLGGVFPPGIPVGTIIDWRTVGYGLYTEARVKLSADLNRSQELMVMLP